MSQESAPRVNQPVGGGAAAPAAAKVGGARRNEQTAKKAHTSLARPRFWQSKVSGMNLRLHPRGAKQGWAAASLGRERSGLNVARVDDRRPRQVRTKACFQDLYLGATAGKATRPWLGFAHPKLLDRRVDVVLHRSGLANSIAQARQRVSHGLVRRSQRSPTLTPTPTSTPTSTPSPTSTPISAAAAAADSAVLTLVKSPSTLIRVGELVAVERMIWGATLGSDKKGTLREVSASQWKQWGAVAPLDTASTNAQRVIPPYLEVDYINGTVVVTERPTASTIILPPGVGAFVRGSL
jgi:hypothetical protein